MGRMAEVWAAQQEHMDEQEALHQLSVERLEMAEDAAQHLVAATRGMGLDKYITILCREAGVDLK